MVLFRFLESDHPHVFHIIEGIISTNAFSQKRLDPDLIGSLDVSLLQHQVRAYSGLEIPVAMRASSIPVAPGRVADLEAMVDRGDYAVAFSMQPVQVSIYSQSRMLTALCRRNQHGSNPNFSPGLLFIPLSLSQ